MFLKGYLTLKRMMTCQYYYRVTGKKSRMPGLPPRGNDIGGVLYQPFTTAEQFMFLLFNQQIHINRASFDEKKILSGKWSKAYQTLRDNGNIQVFDQNIHSDYIIKRFKEIRTNMTFRDPNNQLFQDLLAFFYCDQHEIPIVFANDELYNNDINTNREGHN